MTLPASGLITLDDIRTEVGLTGAFSMGSTYARLLARKESGTISMTDFYGKSCAVYEVTVATHSSTTVLYGYVKQNAPEAPGSDAGSISPNGNFKNSRFSSIAERENSETFGVVFPFSADNQSQEFIPSGFYYAIHINGQVFYESDATIGGAGGGITSYTWPITRPFFSAGQTYTMRIFY